MQNRLATVLKWGVYCLALMPLIIFKDFLSPFHFGKVIVFRVVIEIFAVLYVWLILSDRSYLPKRTPLFWAIMAFTAAYGLTSLTGINPYQSIMGTLERMGGWFTLLHFWVFYIIITSIMRTKEDWVMLLQISVLGGAWSVFYGFLQKTSWDFIIGSGGRPRIFGTIGNTALFAGYTIINTFFALVLVLIRDTVKTKRFFLSLLAFIPTFFIYIIFASGISGIIFVPVFILLLASIVGIAYGICYGMLALFKWKISFVRFFNGLVFLASVVAVVSTAVRGSVIGIIAALCLFALLYAAKGASREIKMLFVGLALFLVIGEGILVLNRNSDYVKRSGYLQRMSDISINTRTVQTRLWAWQAGIDGWDDSAKTVLLGWGPENFNVPFAKHFNPKFYNGAGSETLFDRAHNMFVEVLVTMGIIGFAAYISMFAVLFWMFWKLYRQEFNSDNYLIAVIFICGLLAYLIHNSFIFDTSANFIVFFMFAGFASFLFQEYRRGIQPVVNEPIRSFPTTLRYSAVLILSVAVIISIYQTDLLPAAANYATTRAIVASWAGDHATAVAKFKQALAYDSFPAYEIRHRYAQYVLENYGSFKKENGLDAGQVILSAIDEAKKNTSYKLDYLPYLYIGRAYIILGKNDPKSPFNDLALENIGKALDISPNFVRTYYEVAQVYLNKKDYASAIASFKKAVDLNPEVALTWWYYGIAQVQSGDSKGGVASIEKAISLGYNYNTEGDLLRFIGAYAAVPDYPKIVTAYLRLIELRPNDPQYHASLAQTYATMGKIDDAVREAKIAARLEPSFETEARAFVQKLGRTW